MTTNSCFHPFFLVLPFSDRSLQAKYSTNQIKQQMRKRKHRRSYVPLFRIPNLSIWSTNCKWAGADCFPLHPLGRLSKWARTVNLVSENKCERAYNFWFYTILSLVPSFLSISFLTLKSRGNKALIRKSKGINKV